MVQKSNGKHRGSPSGIPAAEPEAPAKRGRPRAFAAEVALARAMDTFRDSGFAGTSLDDLSAAMGINRPSLYGAFGDKRELFGKAYERYRAEMAEQFAAAFAPDLTLRQALEKAYATAIAVYSAGENGPRGCFTVMTAASEVMADERLRETVTAALASTDRAMLRLFERARERGELPPDADVAALAPLAASVFHSLAVRARARAPRAELEALARGAVALLCTQAR